MKEMLVQLGKRAKDAEAALRTISTDKKNQVLAAVADHLVESSETLLKANEEDVKNGKANHMPEGLVDRLLLTRERIKGMADGLRQLVDLEDPVGRSYRNEKTSQRTSDRTEKSSSWSYRNYL